MRELRIIAFTQRGFALAHRLGSALPARVSRCGQPLSLAQWTKQAFSFADGLIFVGAAGIAVRAIAPHLKSKDTDPAVVVLDEKGRYVIPILSGHLGGANALAREIAALTGGEAVLTTATDVNGVFAIDDWARGQGMSVSSPAAIRRISSTLLEGGEISVSSDWYISGTPPRGVAVEVDDESTDVRITLSPGGGEALYLVPRIVVLGVGCKKGVSRGQLEAAFLSLMRETQIAPQAVCRVCSIDLKRQEEGLQAFCSARRLPLETFSAHTLSRMEGAFESSDFVHSVTGVDNVCQRSALAGSRGGRLLTGKRVFPQVTMALAARPFYPTWRTEHE